MIMFKSNFSLKRENGQLRNGPRLEQIVKHYHFSISGRQSKRKIFHHIRNQFKLPFGTIMHMYLINRPARLPKLMGRNVSNSTETIFGKVIKPSSHCSDQAFLALIRDH